VEAWMAERALRAGRPAEARAIAERTIAFRRGPTLEEPPYEWTVLVDALAAARDWSGLDAILPEARARVGFVAWLEPAIHRAAAGRAARTPREPRPLRRRPRRAHRSGPAPSSDLRGARDTVEPRCSRRP